ncbi:kinase-like protein, partial [Ramicandelaber brevisporus]
MSLPDRSLAGQLVGYTLDNGRYKLAKSLGLGTYGEVYLAHDRLALPASPSEFKAIKCIPTRGFAFTDIVQQLIELRQKVSRLNEEIRLHLKVPPHPNVVRLHRVLHINDVVFMIMDYIPGGDLYENIVNHPSFKSPVWPDQNEIVRDVFLQIAQAIAHCHKHGVYHRDIKPENVCLIPINKDDVNNAIPRFHVKIIDFGLATDRPYSNEIGCGSAYYMDPHCQGGIHQDLTGYYTAPNDVWALGVILVNLASGRNPWNQATLTDPIFTRFYMDRSFLRQALPLTDQFAHILSRVFTIEPENRITLPELYALVASCPRFM